MKTYRTFIICLIAIMFFSITFFNIRGIETVFAEPDEIGEEIPGNDDTTNNPQLPEDENNNTSPTITDSPSSNNNSGIANPINNNVASTQSQAVQSIDTRLSELTINCGTLIPEFSPDIYEYVVYVNRNQESRNCGTSAVAADNSASITAEGPLEFENEDIIKKIIVTGTNGEMTEYVINVHIVKDTELIIENKLYKITETPDLSLLPSGFKTSTEKLNNESITVAKSNDGNLLMVQYVNDSDKTDYKWYRFDAKTGNFYPSDIKEINDEKYIVISSKGEVIYGAGSQGIGYYLYNEDTGEIECFIMKTDRNNTEPLYIGTKTVLFVSIAIALICILACIIMYKKLRKQRSIKQDTNKYFRPYISVNKDEEIKEENI